MHGDAGVVDAAARLARAAPNEWREFLKELEARSTQLQLRVIAATVETLQVNQGQAREAVGFLQLLRSAVEVADRVQVRRNA